MLSSLYRWLGRSPVRWHAVLAGIFVAALGLELFWLHALDTTEYRLSDVFMRRHAATLPADPDIVVVDIDNRSMTEMQQIAGLWSWPREIHADLLMALQEFSPRAIVFDIAFSERDMYHKKSDANLSEAMKAAQNVYLSAVQLEGAKDAQPTPLASLAKAFALSGGGAQTASAALQLPEAVDRSAWRLGLINSMKDSDGVSRRYRLYNEVDGWRLPSLPARVAADLGARIPEGSNFVMRWPAASRKHYPYSDLYKLLTEQRSALRADEVRTIDALFRNKIIVVGSSAAGSFDHLATPLTPDAPGVDILATAIDNLKNGHAMHIVSAAWMLALGAVLISIVAFAFARRVNPALIGIGLLTVSLAALAGADASVERNLLVPVATPLVFAWAWFLFAAIAGYLRERRSREQAVSLFGRFLNPVVVGKMVNQGETVESLSGRNCTMTVLFSDIRGFTTLSETREPKEVVTLLNRYFDRQVEVVFRHGGTLDKFIGDCIMAFWGAPADDAQHALHAVAAAMEMQEIVLAFKKDLIAEGSDVGDFDIGIGVHTGHAVVGFIGAQKKLDYTAIGDTVNLASRVEGLTKGVARVLVTRETMLACGDNPLFTFEARGAFPVKGRSVEVELYEPIRKENA